MIQRIQTIYLFLAAIAGLLTFFLPFAHFTEDGITLAEYAMFGLFNLQSDIIESSGPFLVPAWILGFLATLVPAIAIFLYKNRLVQMKVVRLGYLTHLGFVVYLFFAVDSLYQEFFPETVTVLYHVGFYLPVTGIVFSFLALRGVKKDEALVKSLDRIR